MPCSEQSTCNGYLRLDCHWCDKDDAESLAQQPDVIPSASGQAGICPR